MVVGVVLEYVEYNNITVEKGLETLCSYMPGEYGKACTDIVDIFGLPLFILLEETTHPDKICRGLTLCKGKETECTLYPGHRDMGRIAAHVSRYRHAKHFTTHMPKDMCDFEPFKEICKIIKLVEDHYPAQDLDQDHFSVIRTLRGASWRGKDCNDFDKLIYPGRGDGHDAVVDTNCNGIVGIDADTGESYEDLWCRGTQSMGSVVYGDSVGAHFHLPRELVDPIEIGPETYKYLPEMVENEFDWPMESAATGYKLSEWDTATGEVKSLYQQLLDLNRCNHRDYQNIAVNGASSTNIFKIIKTLARNITRDKPIFAVLALLGNDVCNSHHSMDHMTTVDEFKKNMNEVLDYLEATLPESSVVLAVGLADGRVLYDNMHNRIHPVSSFLKDITYRQFYNYLNCLEISPCFGWLNDNETWRNVTNDRALNLSKALNEVVDGKNYKRIKLVYIENPIAKMIKEWESQGKEGWELIEPVDGFHTSRMGQALTAKVLYEVIKSTHPELLPPENPNNAKIENKFGSQNGY